MKKLIFLLCGEKRTPGSFLFRKPTELVHIPITDKTTYDQLADKLILKYKDDHLALAAVYAWISTLGWHDIKSKEVSEIDPEPGVNLFAIFDLKNV